MRRYYFLIRLFVLSHMIFTIACNGNNGSDVDNESIQILYEDQNEEASKTATSFIDFAEAYENALDTLNSLEPDDPNVEDVLDDISGTLGPLADDMVASTTNLISLEEQIQIALGNGNAQVQRIEAAGFQVVALTLLTMLGVGAAAGAAAVDAYEECHKLPQNPGELDALHAIRVLECVWDNMPQSASNALKAAVVGLGETVGVAVLPHGKVKVTAEILHAGQSSHHVHEFFGAKQDGCSTQNNPRIQNSAFINSVTAASQDDLSPGDLYIAQSDGSEDGVFPFIPEGDWAFLAFTPDHIATFIPCVHVSADQTTDITIAITPIDQDDDVTTTTVTGGDEDNIPDLSYNHCGIQVEVHGYKHSVAPDYTRDYDGDVTIHSWEKYPGSFSGNTFTGNYSRSYGSSLIITGTITATLDTSATMITSINWTEHHLSDGNTSDDSFSGTNILLDYSTNGSVVFQIKGEETCDHISSLSSNIDGGADGLNESLENYECNGDSKIYVSFSTE